MKALLNDVAGSRLGDALMRRLEQRFLYRPGRLRVLTYHRVGDPAGFKAQMEYLAEHYPVVSMAEVLLSFENGSALPPGAVLLTFDDAYQDFADIAWPVLRQHGLPVTLFVPTGFPDHPERAFWWDRLRRALETRPGHAVIDTPVGRLSLATAAQRRKAYRRLRRYVKALPHDQALAWTDELCSHLGEAPNGSGILDWDTLRRLWQEGVTLGAHTRNHPLMNRIAIDDAEREALSSLEDLIHKVGPVPRIFAYPDGRFSQEVIERLRRTGFELAFTTARGTNVMRTSDPLRLRRNNIQRLTVPVLRARLLHSAYPLSLFGALD